jgi:hypothetical protein
MFLGIPGRYQNPNPLMKHKMLLGRWMHWINLVLSIKLLGHAKNGHGLYLTTKPMGDWIKLQRLRKCLKTQANKF